MRRFLALFSGVVLIAALAGPTVAVTPPAGTTSFVGNCDTLVGANKVGRISAQLWVPTGNTSVAGSYSWVNADGASGDQAVLSAAKYYRSDTQTEVWFKGFSVGWPADPEDGPGYAMWIGHFVDVLDPTAVDYFEVSGQGLDIDFAPYPQALIELPGHQWPLSRFDVGKGSFVLRVPASCGSTGC